MVLIRVSREQSPPPQERGRYRPEGYASGTSVRLLGQHLGPEAVEVSLSLFGFEAAEWRKVRRKVWGEEA